MGSAWGQHGVSMGAGTCTAAQWVYWAGHGNTYGRPFRATGDLAATLTLSAVTLTLSATQHRVSMGSEWRLGGNYTWDMDVSSNRSDSCSNEPCMLKDASDGAYLGGGQNGY